MGGLAPRSACSGGELLSSPGRRLIWLTAKSTLYRKAQGSSGFPRRFAFPRRHRGGTRGRHSSRLSLAEVSLQTTWVSFGEQRRVDFGARRRQKLTNTCHDQLFPQIYVQIKRVHRLGPAEVEGDGHIQSPPRADLHDSLADYCKAHSPHFDKNIQRRPQHRQRVRRIAKAAKTPLEEVIDCIFGRQRSAYPLDCRFSFPAQSCTYPLVCHRQQSLRSLGFAGNNQSRPYFNPDCGAVELEGTVGPSAEEHLARFLRKTDRTTGRSGLSLRIKCRFQVPLKNGITYLVSYKWSKTMSITGANQDPYSLRGAKSLADFDILRR